MGYTKKQFGLDLKRKIAIVEDPIEISRWAFTIYRDYGLEFENGLDYFVLKIIAMEEGPEFLLSKNDLSTLADKLIEESDKA